MTALRSLLSALLIWLPYSAAIAATFDQAKVIVSEDVTFSVQLGARLEKHVATGRNFTADGARNQWVAPASRPPTGEL